MKDEGDIWHLWYDLAWRLMWTGVSKAYCDSIIEKEKEI